MQCKNKIFQNYAPNSYDSYDVDMLIFISDIDVIIFGYDKF